MNIRVKIYIIFISFITIAFTCNSVLASIDSESTMREVSHRYYTDKNQIHYQYNEDTLTANIVGYMGSEAVIKIPASITIEDDTYMVTMIQPYAFYHKELTSVEIPKSITSIGTHAFYRNNLTEIIIPCSVTSIGSYAFWHNQLIHIDIASSVTTIGRSAFRDNQLTSVVLPNSLITIKEQAFANNNITNVIMPSSLTSIGSSTFLNNPLEIVFVEDNDATRIKDILDVNAMKGVTIDHTLIGESSSRYESDVNLVNEITVGESLSFRAVPQIKYRYNNSAFVWNTHVPEVQWHKDENALVEQTDRQLTLFDLQVEDAGIYYAKVDTVRLDDIQVNVIPVEQIEQPDIPEKDKDPEPSQDVDKNTQLEGTQHHQPVQTAGQTNDGKRHLISAIIALLCTLIVVEKSNKRIKSNV